MLTRTFSHLRGVSKKRERDLWARGIVDWQAYRRLSAPQLSLFKDDFRHELRASETAHQAGDIGFFRDSLARADYYRLALEYPAEVMFLDIETTGLSLYYDHITVIGWSLGERFGLYVRGDDVGPFLAELRRAKVVVTFNGTLFDLKFIAKQFSDPPWPAAHLDLRYFAKRVGLSGGQKAIERTLDIARQQDLEDMSGEAAPILWHRYRRGDRQALQRLIAYNHADVEGMKAILDESIERLFEQEGIPEQVRVAPDFRALASSIGWIDRPAPADPYAIYLAPFRGATRPAVTYRKLTAKQPLDSFCVVGIDLVASQERESGYCVLRGNRAETARLTTDRELIDRALAAGAQLISIDSPLSIPKGRTSYFDDDPQRAAGIMRRCERIMKRRGINSYPALIPSMQKLTRRGVELATAFRRLGVPVIESYPGAAQDIMSVPRKQAGLEYLAAGLAEFGIQGEYRSKAVSHDELDAITSAVVGQFFWSGMFEALGDEDEDYLIIPDLAADAASWLGRSAIIISGAIAAGKTTAAQHLAGKGYTTTRYSQVLEGMLRDQGEVANGRRESANDSPPENPRIQAAVPTREALQRLGREINETKGQRWLGYQVMKRASDAVCVAIDGVRFREDVAFAREQFGPRCVHLHVEATEALRAARMKANRSRENLSMDEAAKSKTEADVSALASLADFKLSNNGTIGDFHRQIDDVLAEIGSAKQPAPRRCSAVAEAGRTLPMAARSDFS